MTGNGIAVLAAVAFVIGALSGGALVFSFYKSRAVGTPDAVLNQEEGLEKTDPHTLVSQSLRADDLRGRESSLVAAARKRIRDKARGAISGNDGTGNA
jgi:hypothetical protein